MASPALPALTDKGSVSLFSSCQTGNWIEELTEISKPQSDLRDQGGDGLSLPPDPTRSHLRTATVPPGNPGCLISSRALMSMGTWQWERVKQPKPTTFVMFSTPALKISSCRPQADNKAPLHITSGDSPVPLQPGGHQVASSLPRWRSPAGITLCKSSGIFTAIHLFAH